MLLIHSWCWKQVAIPLLVMVRPKGVCVGCPAATLQVLTIAYRFLAPTRWISACLMMRMVPKQCSFCIVQSTALQSPPVAASPLNADFDGAVSAGEIPLWLKHQWHILGPPLQKDSLLVLPTSLALTHPSAAHLWPLTAQMCLRVRWR